MAREPHATLAAPPRLAQALLGELCVRAQHLEREVVEDALDHAVPARIGAKAGECVPASFRGGCETLRCGRAPRGSDALHGNVAGSTAAPSVSRQTE